jgi:hypothetical protein
MFGEPATINGLMKELDIKERLEGLIINVSKQLFVVRGVMSQRCPPWQRRESQAREKQADDHYALHRSRDERAWEWFRLRHRPPTAKNVGERRNDADDADDRSRYAAAAQRLDASHIPISVIWFPI